MRFDKLRDDRHMVTSENSSSIIERGQSARQAACNPPSVPSTAQQSIGGLAARAEQTLRDEAGLTEVAQRHRLPSNEKIALSKRRGKRLSSLLGA